MQQGSEVFINLEYMLSNIEFKLMEVMSVLLPSFSRI